MVRRGIQSYSAILRAQKRQLLHKYQCMERARLTCPAPLRVAARWVLSIEQPGRGQLYCVLTPSFHIALHGQAFLSGRLDPSDCKLFDIHFGFSLNSG